jgi:hypothetical protein
MAKEDVKKNDGTKPESETVEIKDGSFIEKPKAEVKVKPEKTDSYVDINNPAHANLTFDELQALKSKK